MPSSPDAVSAFELASSLQARFVKELENVANRHGQSVSFEETKWLRDEGLHGGGNRFTAPEGSIFNRASVNVSQIHYDDQPDKKLDSATAISTIIHPGNPHAPSVHCHISWTEMKNGNAYWRIMGDLNPSVVNEEYKDRFTAAMKEAAPTQFNEAAAQGDRYFYIPALKRHRGVTHFYLESYHTDNRATDHKLAKRFGEAVIDTYVAILDAALTSYPDFDNKARAEQLAYHTLYLFQVLTLDRGTTSGLLVHNQNDVGIMGSLPSKVDRNLLASWANLVDAPQDQLVRKLVDALPDSSPTSVSEETKRALASAVREHYRENPDALALQARGNLIPPTVDNHS